MNKLFSAVAIIGALAMAEPAFAQRMGPGPTSETGTGPGVIPPGGYGPSSPLHDAYSGSAPVWTFFPGWEPVQQSAAPQLPSVMTPPAVSTQSN